MKTAISLPDEIFARADDFAAKHNLSRSALFTAALREYLKAHQKDDLIAQIDSVMDDIGDKREDALLSKSKSTLRNNKW
jgi:metal-responsive CopG/Arc/MetJ family transcriptional regulator